MCIGDPEVISLIISSPYIHRQIPHGDYHGDDQFQIPSLHHGPCSSPGDQFRIPIGTQTTPKPHVYHQILQACVKT